VPVLAYAVVWAFLWGGILHRFDHSGSVGVRFFRAAASRHFRQFLGVSALAGVVTVGLFLTIHPLLFGPVYGWIVTRTDTEPAAFAARVALYIVFGALLAAVSLTADYTRVSLVALTPRSLRDGLAHAGRFIRHQTSSVVVLFLLSVLTFAVALAAYGIADARFGGWRGVLLGQLFVVGRIGLRLVTAAAQLDLYRRSRPRSGA
jgi:hypothetical protein